MSWMLLLFVLLLTFLTPAVVRAQLTPPYTFVPNTTIRATEANANFALLSSALNRNGGEIAGNIAVQAGVTIDGRDISEISDGRWGVNTQSANFALNYAVEAPAQLVLMTNTSAATVTLYEGTSTTLGMTVTVKLSNSATAPVTIATTNSQLIDGQSTVQLTARNQALTFVSLGTNGWVIV